MPRGYLDFPAVLLLVARNVATPRISETATAVLTGMFPFTQRAPNSENAATDSPASAANILALLLVPMREVYGRRDGGTQLDYGAVCDLVRSATPMTVSGALSSRTRTSSPSSGRSCMASCGVTSSGAKKNPRFPC